MKAYSDERREFLRVGHETLLNYKEVKEDKLSQKNEIQTKNISACGLLFRTSNIPPALSSVIWLELDSRMLKICAEMEKDLITRSGGILGRVVRIAEGEPGVSYDVGVSFLRRKNMSNKEIMELLP